MQNNHKTRNRIIKLAISIFFLSQIIAIAISQHLRQNPIILAVLIVLNCALEFYLLGKAITQ